VSPERYRIVLDEIASGSEPGMRFYILVAVSTMVASFGLITNSTAVIIGAMLLAPLMTPIFGMALALIRGDPNLLGGAIRAEVAGVFAAILMSLVLGNLYPALESTPEMLARTKPQLFDLLVAVFSGFAGAYALLDEKISPALPGVAIATAIVPPLANAGLCFSVGAYVGGLGSFLLFFANFLSILLVAAVTFWFAGMTGGMRGLNRETVIKRFGLPFISFLFVAGFLTQTLFEIADDRRTEETIEAALVTELSSLPNTELDKTDYWEEDGKIHALAHVQSSSIMRPTQVSGLQQSLAEQLKRPVELIVRNKIARDVSALQYTGLVTHQSLDGDFLDEKPHPRVLAAKTADTTIRAYIDKTVPGFDLSDLKILQLDEQTVVLASIGGIIVPAKESIEELESILRQRLEDPNLTLVVRLLESSLYTRAGPYRLEISGLSSLKSEQQSAADGLREFLKSELEEMPGLFITGINHNLIGDAFHFVIEAEGLNPLAPETVADLERRAEEKAGRPVELYVSFKPGAVVSSRGFEPYSVTARRIFEKQRPDFFDAAERMLRASGL
jgi:uncharacterized hydrophobic protein (TIGR00271 family)